MENFISFLLYLLVAVLYFFIVWNRISKIVFNKKPTLTYKIYVYHFLRFYLYVNESEEEYFNAFYEYIKEQFGNKDSKRALKTAKKYFSNIIKIEQEVKLSKNIEHIDKIRIINFLFEMSAADERISIKELAYLESVYKLINVSQSVFRKIKAKYIREEEAKSDFNNNIFTSRKTLLSEAFHILDIDINSDADTIKKAYRTLVKIHHPDKVATQGDEAIKKAEVEFQLITEAYEYIKATKGIN